MHMGGGRKGTLGVTAEDVEGCAGDEVVGWVEVDRVGAYARVGYCAVERVRGGGRGGVCWFSGDTDFEVH